MSEWSVKEMEKKVLKRAYVWFENQDIDAEDFVCVHAYDEGELQQKVDEEVAWLNRVKFPLLYVELEVRGVA